MKKTFLKILLCLTVISLLCVSLIGCGNTNWNKDDVTLKNWGAVVEESNGSFVAETANYVYYINGLGDSSEDNTFGMPIKGTLMAADKTDFSKKCVVVPKLFVASDYNAGVYIFGDYVYYGSPSVNKNSSGQIAKDELAFARTKLDGTTTDNFFSVSGLSTEYRIVKSGNDVYIIYYDTADTALKVFNTSDKKTEVICKTDVKATARTLGAYKFVNNGNTGDVVVLYTATVYSEAYNEKDAENSSYTRPSYSYNEVYAYKAGDNNEGECKGVKILDGNTVPAKTYSVERLADDLVFFSATEVTSDSAVKYYAATLSDLYSKNAAGITEITDTTYVIGSDDSGIDATTLIEGLDKVYVYDSESIKVSTITGNVVEEEKILANGITATKLLFVEGDYIYYLNGSSYIARIKINNIDEDEKADITEQTVSGKTVATDWYAPKLIGDVLFYSDNSSYGLTYIKCVNINNEVVADYDDDGDEIIGYHLDGEISLAKMIDTDMAAIAETYIADVKLNGSSELIWEETTEGFDIPSVTEAKAFYDTLSAEAKALINEETYTNFLNYEEAFKYAKRFYEFYNFNDKTDAEKDALETAYNSLKSDLAAFKKSEDFDYTTILSYIGNNLKWNFFNAATDYYSAAE